METLQMSAKERARLEVFGRVKAGDITLVKASEIELSPGEAFVGTLSGVGCGGIRAPLARSVLESASGPGGEGEGVDAVPGEVRGLRSHVGSGMPGGGRSESGGSASDSLRSSSAPPPD